MPEAPASSVIVATIVPWRSSTSSPPVPDLATPLTNTCWWASSTSSEWAEASGSVTTGANASASQRPLMSVRRQSRRSCAPKACATRVSMPSSTPVPETTMGKNSMLPRLPAPIAAAPRRPAITASTNPIDIQPNSAAASGAARRSMGPNSRRRCVPTPMPVMPVMRCQAMSCLRVGLIVYGHQVGERNLGVLLGGGEARVTQQLLNRAQVGAIGQQMRGVGVAEAVRMN